MTKALLISVSLFYFVRKKVFWTSLFWVASDCKMMTVSIHFKAAFKISYWLVDSIHWILRHSFFGEVKGKVCGYVKNFKRDLVFVVQILP